MLPSATSVTVSRGRSLPMRWLYFQVPLSLRMEEMLLERGVVVSYETIPRWGHKFGAAYPRQLRRKKPSRKDIWHLDEIVISIGG